MLGTGWEGELPPSDYAQYVPAARERFPDQPPHYFPPEDGTLIPQLSIAKAREMIVNGTISGGMIPKVEGCFEVVEAGVEGVVIMNGKVPHAVLLELFTAHGAGTLLTR